MTITIPDLWLGACLGAAAMLAAIVGLAWAVGTRAKRKAGRWDR